VKVLEPTLSVEVEVIGLCSSRADPAGGL